MITFPWKKNKYIDDFAILLADEFYSQILPELADEHFNIKKTNVDHNKQLKTKKNNAKKMNQAVNAAISEVKDFRKSRKLGIYGKARLHMKFMERLTQLGYREEIAKKLNEEILLKTP